ncbi:MAG: hypothetical protein F6J92_41550 [Symploca sp. SIO1A3]|nr:hypothetical protein [Symploca sp. SIO1A3]
MKVLQKPWRLVGLTTLISGILLAPSQAVAVPAPLFEPIIDDIRQQLPQGANLRLPAYLPDSPIDLFPHFVSNDKGFWVNIGIEPNCNVPSCRIGAVGVLPETYSWPPQADTVKTVSLISITPDLDGYHLMWGEGDQKSHNILWQQDGQIYGVGALDFAATAEDLVAIARSMVREQPISSANQL